MNILRHRTARQRFPVNGRASDTNVVIALQFDQERLRGRRRFVAVVSLSRKTSGAGQSA
jgi:hypothetical protein